MSVLPSDTRYRPLRSFSGSINHVQDHESTMASSTYHSGAQSSYHSSVADKDLEEARQRLLAHQYDPETEAEDNHLPLPSTANLYQRGSVVRNGGPAVALEPPTPVPNTNPSRLSRYGSVSTYQSHKKVNHDSKRYRLPLLILLGFDWGLVVFLSIICFVLLNNSTTDYWNLQIDKGFFDLVIVATTRTILNILAYNLLGWVTRIVMAFTTVASAFYVPVKTYFLLTELLSSDDSDKQDTLYLVALIMLVFVCFVIPWFIAFFFEFKYLPAEKARLNIPTWWAVKPWVWPRAYIINEQEGDTTPVTAVPPTTLPIAHTPPTGLRRGMTASTVSLDYRTPMGSSRASPVGLVDRFDDDLPPISEEPPLFGEAASPECDRNLSSEDQMIIREGSTALDGLIELTRNNDGWNLDKTQNGIKCYTKQVRGRKVLKLDSVIEVSAQHLWSILYPGNLTPEWNTQCGVNETIYQVDRIHHVVYTTSNAMGPISSRDFVSARKITYRDGAYYSASKSIVTNLKPEISGKVRGENGPNGFVVIAIAPNRCQFIWVYNCNLKGWLPQAVVDQTVSTALMGAYEQLQTYARQRRPQTNQS